MKTIVNEYVPGFPRVIGLVAGAALLLGGYAANAQILEEVVVTAQKREQNLQDVPISVTAFSGEQLSALGINDFVEITQQVPSLQLNTWSPKLRRKSSTSGIGWLRRLRTTRPSRGR